MQELKVGDKRARNQRRAGTVVNKAHRLFGVRLTSGLEG